MSILGRIILDLMKLIMMYAGALMGVAAKNHFISAFGWWQLAFWTALLLAEEINRAKQQ